MNEILHANVFFVIASIATTIFCIMVCIILYQVIKIVRSIRAIVERVEVGSEAIVEDMAQIREYVANGGLFARIIKFFMAATGGGNRKK